MEGEKKMKKTKRILAAALACVMAFSLAACSGSSSAGSSSDDAELYEITLCLDWTPNTNHTGFYVADALGYYEEAGISITIVQPPEAGAVSACSAGQAEFAIDAQDTLAAAFVSDTPMEVTAVAALIQHNTSGIISAAGSGMDTPSGLEGNTYLTWDSTIELAMVEYVVEADGGDFDNVELIPNTVTDEAADVAVNPDHAIWVYAAWGLINAQVSGVDVDFFYFRDIEETFDYYTPVLVANNDFLEEYPEIAEAFLEATQKGYEYAIENPDEAAQMLIDGDTTGSLDGSEDLVYTSQEWLADEYISDAQYWGYIDPERWDAFYAWLYEEGLIETELPAGTGYSNDYLPGE